MNLANIQAAYYMVAATGVLIAAIFYIINLRSTRRAREWELARLHTSDLMTSTRLADFATVLNMEWKDAEDFNRKYGQSNPEMFGMWNSFFFLWETHGILVKNKVIDAEKIHDLGAYAAIVGWEKFKDIVRSRREVWGQDMLSNFEYLAQEMLKIRTRKNPSFRVETILRRLPHKLKTSKTQKPT